MKVAIFIFLLALSLQFTASAKEHKGERYKRCKCECKKYLEECEKEGKKTIGDKVVCALKNHKITPKCKKILERKMAKSNFTKCKHHTEWKDYKICVRKNKK